MISVIVRGLPLVLLIALTGCGVELTGGGQRGETEVVMTDSTGPGGPSPSLLPSRSFAPEGADDGSTGASRDLGSGSQVALVTGSLDVAAGIALLPSEGNPVHLTAGNTSTRLELATSDSVRLALRTLAEASYPEVRVTFTSIEATLETAVLTTSGTLLEGEISVDLSAGPLVIDVPASVVIRDGERTTIVIDLNAALWLPYANPITRRVAPDIVRDAVTVEVR